MKKFLSALAGILALSLTACGTPAADIQQAEITETTSEQTETVTTTTTTETTTTETTTTETTTTVTSTETTVTETEKVCACTSEFQHACCEYLNEQDYLSGGVYFGDINGDDKPEALVEINPYEWTYVLYENENGMQELPLETMSVWGDVVYIADTKQILYTPMYDHLWSTYGYIEYHLYDWDGSDYVETLNLFRESGYYFEFENETKAELGQAYIDGEPVDNDTFEIKLAEFEKLRDGNDYFPIVKPTDENFESYVRENFPCFDNWDIIPDMQQ